MVNTPTAVCRSDNVVQTCASKIAKDLDATPALKEERHTAARVRSRREHQQVYSPNEGWIVMFQGSEFAGGDLIGPELLELASSTPRS